MYIIGHYNTVIQENPATGLRGPVFSDDCEAEYISTFDGAIARLSAMAKEQCDEDMHLHPKGDERDAHVAIWGSLVKTMKSNTHLNLCQLAGPNGRIFWWHKLV